MKYFLTLIVCSTFFIAQAQKKPSLYRAENHLLNERYQEAKEEIDRFIANPDLKKKANVWFLKAKIYLAIMLSDDAQVRALSPEAGVQAAEAYNQVLQNQKQNAGLAIESLSAIEQIWANYIKQGADLYDVKNYEEAYSAFQKAVLVKPEDSISISYAAYLAQNVGEYDEAVGYLNTLIALGQDSPNTYNSLIIIEKTHRQDTARLFQVIDQGLKRFPNQLNYVKEKILLLYAMGEEKKANDLLRSSLKLFPNDLLLLINLAVYYDKVANEYSQAKDYDAADLHLDTAEVYYERALQVEPDHFELNYNYGVLKINRSKRYYNPLAMMDYEEYKRKGAELEEKGAVLIQEALPYLEKSYAQNSEDYDVLLALHQVYTSLKRTEDVKRMSALIEKYAPE